MWNDTDKPLAYFISFRTYGTWLHGDERGSIDRHHNRYGEPKILSNVQRESISAARTKEPPVYLDAARRKVVEAAIHETCSIREWYLRALNVRTNHAHVVVDNPNKSPEMILNAFKANATRMMRQQGLITGSNTPWAAKGSKRWLWNARSIDNAVRYTLHGQGGEIPDFDAD